MMPNAHVFIDGGYLSKISEHLGGGSYLKFDINQFANTISKSQGLWCNGVFYYTAPPFQSSPPTPNESKRKAKYDKFISKLRQIPNFVVREGRCQKIDADYKQKGVDTLLTMDLFETIRKFTKNIILVACDTDFVPILNKIREDDTTNMILFYYSDFRRGSKFSMSNHILTACDKCVLIEMDHFKKSMKFK